MTKAIFSFVGCVVGMAIAAYLLPGIESADMETALYAGVLLGGVYLVVRPLLRLIALPLNILTLGLIYVVLDILILWFVVRGFAGMEVRSLSAAFFAAVIVNLSRSIFGMLAGKR